MRRPAKRHWAWTSVSAWALLWVLVWPTGVHGAPLELRFVDVGQGDAILVRQGEHAVLIDTGPTDDLLGQLERLRVRKLDALIITHNHRDHLGAADVVLEHMPVGCYFDNQHPTKSKLQEQVLRLVAERSVRLGDASEGPLRLEDAVLEFLLPTEQTCQIDENNCSLGVVLKRGTFKALLAGDATVALLNVWLAAGVVPDVDVLKAAHHGAQNGLTDHWLQTARPEVVVIPVAAQNEYGHPDPRALRSYHGNGRQVYRLDQVGDVVVWIADDGGYQVETSRPWPTVVAPGKGQEPRGPAKQSEAGAAVQVCCRRCQQGIPCGDSCIPRTQTCRERPGCACGPR